MGCSTKKDQMSEANQGFSNDCAPSFRELHAERGASSLPLATNKNLAQRAGFFCARAPNLLEGERTKMVEESEALMAFVDLPPHLGRTKLRKSESVSPLPQSSENIDFQIFPDFFQLT